MSAGRFHELWFLGLVLATSCTGMLHEVSGRKSLDVATTATFNLFTNSSYDTPTADWEVVTTDDNFSYYECLVERTSQVTDEVTETGIWETCESPYDLRDPAGIDVEEGFNGQLTVRAVSRSGQAGESITKPFRRAVWAGGMGGLLGDIALQENGLLVGGGFTSINDESRQNQGRISRLNPDGSVDLSARSFLQGFNGAAVQSIVIQDDGKILVGGDFTSYNGSAAAPDRLIRLNANGTIDGTFLGLTTGFDGLIRTIAIQDDGKVLVGGDFTSYNGGAAPHCLIRLDLNGAIDGTFVGLTTGFDAQVSTIAVQDDGKILVGGQFTTYNGGAAPDGLIRLNSDGTIDGAFTGLTTGFDWWVSAIAIQDDGRILVGGYFTTYNGGGSPDQLVRLNTNGTIDGTFTGLTTGFNSQVFAVAIQDDGKILVGGDFTTYNGGAAPDRLLRLNVDGTIDSTFAGLVTGFDMPVYSIAVQDDGKILVAGGFTVYNGVPCPGYLIRLDSSGTIDTTFTGLTTGFDSQVVAIAIQSEGKVIVGGTFTSYNGGAALGRLARLDSNGTIDGTITGLTSGFDNWVYKIAVQQDRKILLGGNFTTYNGGAAPDRLIRLNSNGTIDPFFTGLTSGFNDFVNAIAVQDDGKILVGGNFTSYNGSAAAPDRLMRLSSDGTIDGTFSGITTGFNGVVDAIAIQDDGKILVGGNFTTYNGGAAPDRLVRLNSDGTIDGTFTGLTSGFDATVYTIAIQTDGKILVGGSFTTYNGSAAAPDYLIRLNSNGAIDGTFTGLATGFDSGVSAITVQIDGKILVGGEFTSYNGSAAAPDRLIRLNANGSIDTTFTGLTSGFDAFVNDVTIQSDGKILVGGYFTSYNGDSSAPDYIIRLNTDGTIDQSFMGQRK